VANGTSNDDFVYTSIDVNATIDIMKIVVCWVMHIIVQGLHIGIVAWMLLLSHCSNGTCSQIPSKIHPGFYAFTRPGHFTERWFVTL
jgi:hypothetical protein